MSAKIGFASLVLGLLSFFFYNYNNVFLEKPIAAILLGIAGVAMTWKNRAKGGFKSSVAGLVLGVGYLALVYFKTNNA